MAAISVGARPQLNRVMVRAKVFKGGRPPSTSVGQAKKSDSTMPCSPVLLRKSAPCSKSAGSCSASEAMSVLKRACTTMPITALR